MKIAALLLAGLVASVVATGTAFADDDMVLNPPSGPVRVEPASNVAPAPRPARGKRALPPAIVKRFDRDGDGHLDPRERRHAMRALRGMMRQLRQEQRADARAVRMQRNVIRKYDGNRDGIVGPDEMPQRLQKRMRRMDRNGDGWLDDADR